MLLTAVLLLDGLYFLVNGYSQRGYNGVADDYNIFSTILGYYFQGSRQALSG